MRFRELDPDAVRRLLEEKDAEGRPAHVDVLTPLVSKEDALFRNSTCPACQAGGAESFINPARPFTPGSPLPNRLLRCTSCRTEFDPYTRLVTSFRPSGG